eukprot:PhM_4_TR17522/c0_g1_i1/m.71702
MPSSATHKSPTPSRVAYPSTLPNISVVDMLDPSRPLVKSQKPLTKPKAPHMLQREELDRRRELKGEMKLSCALQSSVLAAQRANEKKYIKAQFEFEREKRLAEKAIYDKERAGEWNRRMEKSPFLVDLVADHERVEEEQYVREREQKHRMAVAEKKKRKLRNEIIVKALAEVPVLEEARRQRKQLLEEQKKENALREVQRVESVQMKKLKQQTALDADRQTAMEGRHMKIN